eukprot:364511-Chlamydomonas_euryale.AAC.7
MTGTTWCMTSGSTSPPRCRCKRLRKPANACNCQGSLRTPAAPTGLWANDLRKPAALAEEYPVEAIGVKVAALMQRLRIPAGPRGVGGEAGRASGWQEPSCSGANVLSSHGSTCVALFKSTLLDSLGTFAYLYRMYRTSTSVYLYHMYRTHGGGTWQGLRTWQGRVWVGTQAFGGVNAPVSTQEGSSSGSVWGVGRAGPARMPRLHCTHAVPIVGRAAST